MHKGCGCYCHKLKMIVKWLALLAVVLFFVSAFRSELVWGYPPTFYFEATVVLALVGLGHGKCRCCMGHGMGYKCEDCKAGGGMNHMGGMEGMK